VAGWADSCSLIFLLKPYYTYPYVKHSIPPDKSRGIPGRSPPRLVQVEWKALLSFVSLSKFLAWLRIVETSQLKLKKLLKWVGSDKYG